MATINGKKGQDTLKRTADDDLINGLRDGVSLSGAGGNDTFNVGDGAGTGGEANGGSSTLIEDVTRSALNETVTTSLPGLGSGFLTQFDPDPQTAIWEF